MIYSIICLVIIGNLYICSGTSGFATHYGSNDNGGACGYNGVSSSSFPFGHYAAVGSDLWNEGKGCGACYQVTCDGPHPVEGNGCGCTNTPSIKLQARDWCPECSNSHLDLKTDTRNAISTCDMTLITFERVSCDYTTNIKVRSKSGTSQHWYGLHIDNVAGNGAINQVFIKSSTDNNWVTCTNQGSFWLCNGGAALPNPALPYDIKFIDDHDIELIGAKAITSFDENTEFDAGVQYGPGSSSTPSPVDSNNNNGDYDEIVSFGGKCLDIDADDIHNDGGKVQIWDCNNAIQQQWYFDRSTGQIRNEGGKCLDVDAGDHKSDVDGGLVQVWECNRWDNQKWTYSNNKIISSNGKCLDVWADWIDRNGGSLQLWECGDAHNQKWNIH